MKLKQKFYNFLRWSEKYTQTDMIYVVKNGFWWVLGKICVLLISIGIMAAFARWVPKEIYGAYRYVLSMVAILSIFALPGMNTALVRAVARGYEKMVFLCAKIKFKWALIGTGICFVTSFWYLFHHNINLGISFLIAGFFLPFINTFQIFVPFWQGKKKFNVRSKYLIFSNFLSALILIPVILFTNNLILIVLVYFASQTIFGALFFKLTLKKVADQEQKEEKETISFGKHLTLIQSATLFSNQIDKIIVWQILGPAAVAIYSFAQLPIIRIQQIIPVAPLALPKLSQKNTEEIKKSLFQKFLKLFLVSLPFALAFILIAPYFYKIFFPNYTESVIYAQILALGLITLPFALLGSSFVAQMKTKELYIIQFSTPILKIALFAALAPFYGIWGIITAILIAQILNSGLVLYFFKKI
jgi:O-antigen/teichoic acid export membrane protein